MNETRVNSWAELQESLFAGSWDSEIGRFRSKYAFRGLSDAAYDLDTTLIRLGGDYEKMEAHLLRNFRKYAHRDVVRRDSVWHWLSVAQHHGLPTRLMDWTYSPFVAMHFATANVEKFNVDSVIWAVHFGKVHQLLPPQLSQLLHDEGSDVFTVEMLASVVNTLRDFFELSDIPYLLFFEPPSMDDRIVNQYALFSVVSECQVSPGEWLTKRPDLWHRIIIPARLKWEIRDKLDQANITERVLFPGLDGLSSWLKRHYLPKME